MESDFYKEKSPVLGPGFLCDKVGGELTPYLNAAARYS
jgi:hypothetical protein